MATKMDWSKLPKDGVVWAAKYSSCGMRKFSTLGLGLSVSFNPRAPYKPTPFERSKSGPVKLVPPVASSSSTSFLLGTTKQGEDAGDNEDDSHYLVSDMNTHAHLLANSSLRPHRVQSAPTYGNRPLGFQNSYLEGGGGGQRGGGKEGGGGGGWKEGGGVKVGGWVNGKCTHQGGGGGGIRAGGELQERKSSGHQTLPLKAIHHAKCTHGAVAGVSGHAKCGPQCKCPCHPPRACSKCGRIVDSYTTNKASSGSMLHRAHSAPVGASWNHPSPHCNHCNHHHHHPHAPPQHADSNTEPEAPKSAWGRMVSYIVEEPPDDDDDDVKANTPLLASSGGDVVKRDVEQNNSSIHSYGTAARSLMLSGPGSEAGVSATVSSLSHVNVEPELSGENQTSQSSPLNVSSSATLVSDKPPETFSSFTTVSSSSSSQSTATPSSQSASLTTVTGEEETTKPWSRSRPGTATSSASAPMNNNSYNRSNSICSYSGCKAVTRRASSKYCMVHLSSSLEELKAILEQDVESDAKNDDENRITPRHDVTNVTQWGDVATTQRSGLYMNRAVASAPVRGRGVGTGMRRTPTTPTVSWPQSEINRLSVRNVKTKVTSPGDRKIKTSASQPTFANELWYRKGRKLLSTCKKLPATPIPTDLAELENDPDFVITQLSRPTASSRNRQVTQLPECHTAEGREKAAKDLRNRKVQFSLPESVDPDRFRGTKPVTAKQMQEIANRLSHCEPSQVPNSSFQRRHRPKGGYN